jgi:citrate lyase subunit beta / citryl-CoA lyase
VTAFVLPQQALFKGEPSLPPLPVCDHYAGSEKFLLRALALQQNMGPCFDVTADLEDGASVGLEAQQALIFGELVGSQHNQFGRMGVRIHDPSHAHWRQDLALVMRNSKGRLAYVTVPKVENPGQLEQIVYVLGSVSRDLNVPVPPVHILIESLEGLAYADSLAAMPAVQCISFGLMDFVSSFGGAIADSALQSPGQFDHPLVAHAKRTISLACHRYGKTASHSVCTNITDGLVAGSDAARARSELGFSRMWSIHPIQIEPIVAALAPNPAQVKKATAILQQAMMAQWGPIQFEGRLHDRASYRLYWAVVQQARAAGHLSPELVSLFFGESHDH